MPQETNTLSSVIRKQIDNKLRQLHTSLPGKVEAYDPVLQKADIKPLIKIPLEDETGAITYYPIPVITDVPVLFPGGNGYRLTFPLDKGDGVLIVFSEASLELWANTGVDSEPAEYSRHDISDAIAIPGLKDFKVPWERAPGEETMSIGNDGDSEVVIDITREEILAGGSDRLAFHDELKAVRDELEAFRAIFNAHIHPSSMGPTGPSTSLHSAVYPDPVGTDILKGG